MKTLRFAAMGLLGVLLSIGVARADVIASPSFQSLGAVPAGRTVMTAVQFLNLSARPVPYFTASCNGDYASFQCNSTCYSLAPYASCVVYVYFNSRSGDGLSRILNVYGQGSGVFTSAVVQASERKE